MLDLIDRQDIRLLRLDRPPVNALSPELIGTLRRAIERAPQEGARALVLAGSPKRFSGGLDVPLLLELDREAIRGAWEEFFALMHALAASPIPIVAAITGHAPAGGTVLALFCDLRVMADGAFKLGLNEVRVGLPLPEIIFYALRRLVGARAAERLAVEGRLIDPRTALELGLVDELAPEGEVEERAVERCRRLLALPPAAMAETRRRARADLVAAFGSPEQREARLDALRDAWFGDECRAAMRAMLDSLAAKKG